MKFFKTKNLSIFAKLMIALGTILLIEIILILISHFSKSI